MRKVKQGKERKYDLCQKHGVSMSSTVKIRRAGMSNYSISRRQRSRRRREGFIGVGGLNDAGRKVTCKSYQNPKNEKP
jgi:hypothetical protein